MEQHCLQRSWMPRHRLRAASCTAPAAGTDTLSVTFTPTDGTDYNTASKTVSLVVNPAAKTTPVITWATPAAITYGTALSAAQLDATASVPGSFTYSPASGTALTAGTHSLSVSFTPTDTTTYNSATATVNLVVNKATPVITWATPVAITYGTTLSAAQLDATASVGGSLVYSPAAGTTPAAGTDTLSVTFTPTDSTDYNTASKTVSLVVNPAAKTTPVITWATPAAITYGTALSAAQLDATASVPGSFTYSPASGTALTAGTHSLSVSFTPTDTTTYNSATATVNLVVNKATPVITWATPVAITYGTTLSAAQLDATASVAGSLVYSPCSRNRYAECDLYPHRRHRLQHREQDGQPGGEPGGQDDAGDHVGDAGGDHLRDGAVRSAAGRDSVGSRQFYL